MQCEMEGGLFHLRNSAGYGLKPVLLRTFRAKIKCGLYQDGLIIV